MSELPEDTQVRRLRTSDASVLMGVSRAYDPAFRRELSARFAGLQKCEIDEVLNIALNSLWKHRGSFDPEKGTVAAWYRTIAINAARDLLRTKNALRRLARLVDPAHLDKVADTRDAGDSAVPQANSRRSRELLAEVESILCGLPKTQRYILLADAASVPDQVDSGVLAAELGVSAATVRKYRQRGLRTVRRRLAERERERERRRLVFEWPVSRRIVHMDERGSSQSEWTRLNRAVEWVWNERDRSRDELRDSESSRDRTGSSVLPLAEAVGRVFQ